MSPRELIDVLVSTLERALTTGRRVRLVMAFEVADGMVVVNAPGGALSVPEKPVQASTAMERRMRRRSA